MTLKDRRKLSLQEERNGIIDGYFQGQRGKNRGLMEAAEDLELILEQVVKALMDLGFTFDQACIKRLQIAKEKALFVHELDEAFMEALDQIDKLADHYGDDCEQINEVAPDWPDLPKGR